MGSREDGLAQLLFRSRPALRIGGLEQGELSMVCSLVGVDLHGFLKVFERGRTIPLLPVDLRQEGVGVCVVAIDGEDSVGLLESFVRGSGRGLDVADLQPRCHVGGIKLHRMEELSVPLAEVAHLDIDFAQLVVGIGIVVIDFEGVRELNDRFFELAIVLVALSTLQIFNLANVGVGSATVQQDERSGERGCHETKCGEAMERL